MLPPRPHLFPLDVQQHGEMSPEVVVPGGTGGEEGLEVATQSGIHGPLVLVIARLHGGQSV